MPHIHVSRVSPIFLYVPVHTYKPSLALALIMLAIGIFIRYRIGKRKFNRRATTGVETFSSYESSVLTRFIERIAGLIALFCIVVGLLLLIMHYA